MISRSFHGTPISGCFDTTFDNVEKREYTLEEYLRISSNNINAVKKLAQATLALYVDDNFSGNGVAIASNLVLTNHCVENKNSAGQVIFDGSEYGLDFKIILFENADFDPVVLDVEPAIGQSIQTYFKVVRGVSCLYLRLFETEADGNYATRSDKAFANTKDGESGAPRMSLERGTVYAIHQGTSEGLKINDIYEVLEKVAKIDSHPQQKQAIGILQSIRVVNLGVRLMNWSPLVLKQGDVHEEKPRIKGEVDISMIVNKRNISGCFGYLEVGEEKGPRHITIHLKKVANSCVTYDISPNPHENKKYNKGGQPEFYRELASVVGRYYLAHNNTYCPRINVEILEETYILTLA